VLGGTTGLWRTAATLGRTRRGARGLPLVWFVTDPARTPDPAVIAARLPRGAGVIFRGFGRPDSAATATRLAGIARRRGLVLLIGADEALAAAVGADGVHLPERCWTRLPRMRARHPLWLLTVAAHSPAALRRAGTVGADAALVSAVFDSRSPSAGRPIGPLRLARQVRTGSTPVFALGGVRERTARRLVGTGVAGFAAVEAFADEAAV
jgi:thiamine-phosphate pyrophosphorylase